MKNEQSLWRWITLVAIIVNVVFNVTVDVIMPGGASIRDMSAMYPTLITPKGYTFAIWGVIYIAYLIYGVYQVLPSTKGNQLLNWLTMPTTALNLLCSFWIICFRYNFIGMSMLVIIAVFTATMTAYLKSQPGILRVPFSLLLAWISVATASNIAIFLYSIAWTGFGIHPNVWAIIVLGAIGAIAVLMSVYRYDFTYCLVIAWATIGIFNARVGGPVATMALIIAAISVIMAVYAIITKPKLVAGNR